jgi:DNA polymerase delta subunit 2
MNQVADHLFKVHIIAPPPRETYRKNDGTDLIVLEDESGRLPITGKFLSDHLLCTGCIVGALGTENKDGEFEIIAIEPVDLPVQPQRWELHNKSLAARGDELQKSKNATGKIAIVSGLELDGQSGDSIMLDTLQEYLLGEIGDGNETGPISRLIIAGNSFGHMSPIPTREELLRKSVKKHGTDPIVYNSSPADQVDAFIACLLPSIPVTLLPGVHDPASVSLPQPAIHPAMFPLSRRFSKHPTDTSYSSSWFDSVSNPWDGEINGWRVLATGGQPVNDMAKYLERPNRLLMMESFLRWRNIAPTAPDTLCECIQASCSNLGFIADEI